MSIELIDLLSRQNRRSKSCERNGGLTLLECLVAIAMIGVSTATIAPVMLFSVATRVQSQKAEQALQLAQLEIDTIRVEVERGNNAFVSSYPKTLETEDDIAETDAPENVYSALTTDPKDARAADIDDDGEDDFAIQVFRTEGVLDPNGDPMAFRVGVRVYDVDAVRNNPSSALLTDQASLAFTSGEGQRGLRPLATLYTDIVSGDRDLSLCNYREYIDSFSSAPAANVNDNIDCS